jgi:regulator of CtrA degradation
VVEHEAATGESDVQATAFFGKTYGEAMDLLVEARDYLAHREPIDREALMPLDRLRFCGETMRLTARLTQIMAWLLAQRAVHAGEISQEEALADHRALAEHELCMDAPEAAMPRRLASLLERSQRLYVRVARLDELARRQLA